MFPPPRVRFTVFLPCYPGFPSRCALPARRSVLLRTVFPLRRALPARRSVLLRAVFPFRRAPSAQRFRPARAIFPLCRALFARRSRLSVWFPVASRVTRSASLPLRPVSRSVPFRASCAPFFLSFAGYYCTRRTSLLFGGLLGKP